MSTFNNPCVLPQYKAAILFSHLEQAKGYMQCKTDEMKPVAIAIAAIHARYLRRTGFDNGMAFTCANTGLDYDLDMLIVNRSGDIDMRVVRNMMITMNKKYTMTADGITLLIKDAYSKIYP
tara:strand:- start:30980 stop:31342 length:363 start_codon:yes stop_codon:yes gene_type:complete